MQEGECDDASEYAQAETVRTDEADAEATERAGDDIERDVGAPQPRTRKRMLVVAALALAGVSVAFGLWHLTRVPVPSVVGQPVSAAEASLQNAGLEVGTVSYDEDAPGDVGAVIAQEPGAGKRVDEGSAVNLVVTGPPPVPTPDLSGLDEREAKAALAAVGLALGTVDESYDETVAAGEVASQTPDAGQDAPDGSEVDVIISLGPEPIGVPNVVGKLDAEAGTTLRSAGFKVKTAAKDDEAAKGVVLAQEPAAGTELQPGGTVALTVSTGAPPRPSTSEVASAIKRLMRGESTVSISKVSSIRMWRDSKGRWWASGWAIPVDANSYDSVEVVIYKSGDTWRLSEYGTGL